MHFLIPLQEFDVPFQPLVYAEKVKKLVLDKMEPLKLLKENKKGSTYQAQDFKVCYRNKGSVSGNNNTSPQKYIYLISGKAEVTAEDEVKEYAAPCFFCIPAKTYHKIEAKTDLSFVLMEK